MAEGAERDRADKASCHRREVEHGCGGARITAALPELAGAVHTEDQLAHDAECRKYSCSERRVGTDGNSDERARDGNQANETALYGMTEFRQTLGSRPDPLRREL